MKSKLTLTPFVNEFSCGFKVCSNNRPFATLSKYDDGLWYLGYTVRFPKYLGVGDEHISKEISYTRKVIEIMAHISSIKDEQMAKYKSVIEMYHTNRLKSQLNRYEKFSDVVTVVFGDVEDINWPLFSSTKESKSTSEIVTMFEKPDPIDEYADPYDTWMGKPTLLD